MKQPIAVAMAGGGTGGHVIPALAVAHELKAMGHRPFFIGTRSGMEARLVPNEGFEIDWVEIGQFNRVSTAVRLRTLAMLPLSIVRAMFVLRRRKARAVFSMGGYVAAPVVVAAVLLGIPVVAMEPNAVPGLVNRRLGRAVSRALLSFAEAAKFFPPGRSEVTGVPVRREFFESKPKEPGDTFTLLVTGGSRGSRTLNRATRESWPLFASAAPKVRVILQSGKDMEAELAAEFAETGLEGSISAFVTDMPDAFEAADLVVCRSGASTVAELAAAGKPAILVPFPYAADDHQLKNAQALAAQNAARVVPDSDLSGQRLFEEVMRFVHEPALLREFRTTIARYAKPNAAVRAAAVLEEVACELD